MMDNQDFSEKESGREAQIKELGSRLRSIREAQGLGIADVSSKTRIQKHYIAAIEEGNLKLLPKGPYIRSFVRQYCEYLSAGDLWNTYDALTKTQNVISPLPTGKNEDLNYSDSHKIFKPKSYIWLYLLVIVSLGAAGWITWRYRGDLSNVATTPIDGGTVSVTQPVSSGTDSADSADIKLPSASMDIVSGEPPVDLAWMDGNPSAKGTAEPKAAAPKEQQPAESRSLKIVADGGSVWVKISQSGTIFFEGILKNGEFKEYNVGPNNPIRVRFGNPGKTTVVWDTKTISPAGAKDKPVTTFFWPDGKVSDKER